jgi:hypothetical protein
VEIKKQSQESCAERFVSRDQFAFMTQAREWEWLERIHLTHKVCACRGKHTAGKVLKVYYKDLLQMQQRPWLGSGATVIKFFSWIFQFVSLFPVYFLVSS